MAKDKQFHQEVFGPADVYEMTGVSVATQSNWRRHGYVDGSQGGWNKYSLYQTAGFAIMKHLNDRGVSLASARLTNSAPDDEKALSLAQGMNAKAADIGAPRVLLFAFTQPGAVVDAEGNHVSEPPIQTPHDFAKRYLFVLDGGTAKAANDLEELGEDFSSAAIVDLQRLGRDIALRAGRPLMKFL